MALGDLVDIAAVAAESAIGVDIPGVGKSKSSSDKKKGPIRGARLEYKVEKLGGRILMKEPYGNWFDIKPVYPDYGKFKKGKNSGKQYTKRGGFRFKSYTILLKPGTSIVVPKAKAADQRKRDADTGTESVKIGNISIGVSDNVNVHEFIDWLKASKQKANIIGLISPTLRKYQWGGILQHASN